MLQLQPHYEPLRHTQNHRNHWCECITTTTNEPNHFYEAHNLLAKIWTHEKKLFVALIITERSQSLNIFCK